MPQKIPGASDTSRQSPRLWDKFQQLDASIGNFCFFALTFNLQHTSFIRMLVAETGNLVRPSNLNYSAVHWGTNTAAHTRIVGAAVWQCVCLDTAYRG